MYDRLYLKRKGKKVEFEGCVSFLYGNLLWISQELRKQVLLTKSKQVTTAEK